MIQVYLSSVAVWMIIIYCLCWLFKNAIKNNGWISQKSDTSKTNKLVVLFVLSAVPIIRFIVCVTIVFMSMYTKEDFEKFKAEVEAERSNNL